MKKNQTQASNGISNEEYKKDTRNLLIYVGVFAFMVFIVTAFPYEGETSTSSVETTLKSKEKTFKMPDQVAIRVMGKRFIEQKITTNSVEFDGMPKVEINLTDSTYYVIGHITYVNVYNAPMKSLFAMKIKYLGGEEGKIANYELQSLGFDK